MTEISLVIGWEGGAGDYRETIVYATLDRQAADAECARLKLAVRETAVASAEYWFAVNQHRRRRQLDYPLIDGGIGLSAQAIIDAEVARRFGPPPPEPLDGYTVLTVPTDQAGRWRLDR